MPAAASLPTEAGNLRVVEETAMPSGGYIEGQAFWANLGAASLKFHHPVGGHVVGVPRSRIAAKAGKDIYV